MLSHKKRKFYLQFDVHCTNILGFFLFTSLVLLPFSYLISAIFVIRTIYCRLNHPNPWYETLRILAYNMPIIILLVVLPLLICIYFIRRISITWKYILITPWRVHALIKLQPTHPFNCPSISPSFHSPVHILTHPHPCTFTHKHVYPNIPA